MSEVLNAVRRFKKRILHTRLVDLSSLHEVEERRMLGRIFTRLNVQGVLDIGANKGGFARNALKAMPRPVPIVCVEPNAAAIGAFKASTAANERISVLHVAVSDRNEEGLFHITANDEFSSLKKPRADADGFENKVAVTNSIEVEMLTLDSLIARSFPDRTSPDLLVKLDTQGMDYDILDHSTELADKACCIISEVEFSNRLYGSDKSWTDHIEMVQAKGFKLAALYTSNPGHFPDLHDMNAVFVNRTILSDAKSGHSRI